MPHIAVRFSLKPNTGEWKDILIALLDNCGFEGVFEDDDLIVGYIPQSGFYENLLAGISHEMRSMGCELSRTNELIPEQNWNEVWESNFDPVIIDTRCVVRAPFHPPFRNMDYQIVIEPKMSFGTGHHATTRLMLEQLLEIEMTGYTVLDMGCGTGVLGILCCMQGAGKVTGVDIDIWAYTNSIENAERNNARQLSIIHGGLENVPCEYFDLVLANINRNILLEQIPDYAKYCRRKGRLLLSGILQEDIPVISSVTCKCGFHHLKTKESNNWVMMMFEMK
jgi:ribosomal protein L11 methyltransferase